MKGMLQNEMQQEVLRRIGQWHAPIPDLVKDTPLMTIWGTSLLDRDPQIFMDKRKELEIHGRIPSRVVLMGDAAHSMSPFKGQGANQALADGPLLANWLSKSNTESAVRGFMTEMTRRSGVKVRASRESAKKLHSYDCWEWMVQQDKPPGDSTIIHAVIHGVQAQHVTTLLKTLEEREVNASLGALLDEKIRSIIQELNIADTPSKTPTNINDANSKQLSYLEIAQLQSRALEYSLTGNISELRQLSRKSHLIIPNALNSHKRTCLHTAAMNGHVDICRWLLSEVGMDCNTLDTDGKEALDLAVDNGRDEAVHLLKKWIDEESSHCDDSKHHPEKSEEDDIYRDVEQQLRGIQTVEQLRSLLQKNRDGNAENEQAITHVLGFHVDESDVEYNKQCMNVLAQEHGAVLLKNFISREVDQLALGALALRPLNFDTSGALEKLRADMNDDEFFKSIIEIGSSTTLAKSAKKRLDKCVEEVKSQLTIPADSSVAVQTNFWPQIQQYRSDQQPKKQKIDCFPLSRLRYINLGELNYNWGDRRYEKVNGAAALPDRLISLAQQAHEVAKLSSREVRTSPVSFDMAICNLYHLQRPSDRLGGHRDNVESNLSLPLVTFSLGAPGIFLLGGKTRATKPTVILLEPGDCMVMSGMSRRYFHGVPTILSPDITDHRNRAPADSQPKHCIFPEFDANGNVINSSESQPTEPSLDEMRLTKAFLSSVRMNLSIRQVL